MHRWFLLICFVLAACDSGGNSGRSDDTDDDFPGGDTTLTGSIHAHFEFEPNDDVAIAQPITLPTPAPSDDFVGFQVEGQVSLLSDPADTFAFTATRSRMYSIELCQSDCLIPLNGVSLDTSVAFFEVLDQSGTVLFSTQGDTFDGNYLDVSIDAGVLYYVSVRAETTMSGSQDYSLIAIESIF